MSEDTEREGWSVPIVQSLTRRVMYGGIPMVASILLAFLAYSLFLLKLYVAMVLPVALFFVLRKIYAIDQWAPGAYLDHLRHVLRRSTKLDV